MSVNVYIFLCVRLSNYIATRFLWHAYVALMVCECLFVSCIIYTVCVPTVNVCDSAGERVKISPSTLIIFKHGTISVVESFSLPSETSRALPFKRFVSFASHRTVILYDANRRCGIKLARFCTCYLCLCQIRTELPTATQIG